MSSPPVYHYHHHHHTHLLYLLGRRDEERKLGGRGGGRKRDEKQIKSHKLLEMSLLRCEKRREGKKRYVQQRQGGGKGLQRNSTAWRLKWWVFDSSPPALGTNGSRRTTFFFFPLQEESYPNETETRHRNWPEALKQIKRRKGDRRGAKAMEADSKKHRFRKGRSATFSIDGFNITIGKNLQGRQSRGKG